MVKLILGIDEAGRGPVIGPMVMAGCLTTAEIDHELKTAGVKDSKMLLAGKREKLFPFVQEKVLAYEIIIISPNEIDSRDKVGLNLNQLEAVNSIKIISSVLKQYPCDELEVILDSPTINTAAYKEYVEGLLSADAKKKITIRPEIKADQNHVSVSAGSILAKVTRDDCVQKLLEKIQKRFGSNVDIGSGYPSDPYTVSFIQKYWDKVEDVEGIDSGFFRKSWETWKNIARQKAQRKLF
jgi:ribonuclease HII